MATITSRLTNQGVYILNGSFDETIQASISTKIDTILAADFDEVSLNPMINGLAKRELVNGNLLVANYFDEFTGAPLVDSNLKVWLDTGQISSYSGSGLNWQNLNSTIANATLYNSPTFNSIDSGGILNFNKDNFEFAEIPYLGDFLNWTVEAWAKVTSSLTGQITSIVTGQYDLVDRLNFSIGTNRAPTSYNLCAGFYDGSWRNTTGFSPTLNTWYQLVGTYDGSVINFYVNGALNSFLNYSGTSLSGGTIRIARRWDGTAITSTNFFPGDIAIVKIYDRSLSADEVQQNFNSARRRFNI
jgi:hypothetical protein